MKIVKIFHLLFFFFFVSTAFADDADVIEVAITNDGENSYSFRVTVFHRDTGWNHFANKWDIVDENGTIIGTRILHHPHVGEQPFTRALDGVVIPGSIKTVTIRAHDSVHGYGGRALKVELP